MKFLTLFLTLFLAWTAAAAVSQDRATKSSSKATGKPTQDQADLIKASKKGVAKITIPKPPAKGKKVSRQSPSHVSSSLDAVSKLLQTRENKIAPDNGVVTGTASDTVETSGLGTCTGIIVTFDGITHGKTNKIAAHVGPEDGQSVISNLIKEIYNAAAEGGLWDMDLDAGHQPHIFVTYPNVHGEITDMVQDNMIAQTEYTRMVDTLTQVNTEIEKSLESLRSQLLGRCYIRSRTHSAAVGGNIQATTNGVVTADGHPF